MRLREGQTVKRVNELKGVVQYNEGKNKKYIGKRIAMHRITILKVLYVVRVHHYYYLL